MKPEMLFLPLCDIRNQILRAQSVKYIYEGHPTPSVTNTHPLRDAGIQKSGYAVTKVGNRKIVSQPLALTCRLAGRPVLSKSLLWGLFFLWN